jgi:hypothetical protein
MQWSRRDHARVGSDALPTELYDSRNMLSVVSGGRGVTSAHKDPGTQHGPLRAISSMPAWWSYHPSSYAVGVQWMGRVLFE